MALIRTSAGVSNVRCLLGYNRPTNTVAYYKDANGTTGLTTSSVTLADFTFDLTGTNPVITKTGNRKVFVMETSAYSGTPTVTETEVTDTLTLTGYGVVAYSI